MDETETQKSISSQIQSVRDTTLGTEHSGHEHSTTNDRTFGGGSLLSANQLQQLLEQTVQQAHNSLLSDIPFASLISDFSQIIPSSNPLGSTSANISSCGTNRNHVDTLTSPALFFSSDTTVLVHFFMRSVLNIIGYFHSFSKVNMKLLNRRNRLIKSRNFQWNYCGFLLY
jgi:hypothetical protein